MIQTAGAVAQAAVKTAAGESINNGIWTLVAVVVTTVGGIVLAVINKWGPWKQVESADRAADFSRLREDIDAQKAEIVVLRSEVRQAQEDAAVAREHSNRSDAKLQSALTACEVLSALVEREIPNAPEMKLVKRLLAQAASDDMGIGDGMRKLATIKGVGE